MVKPLHVIIPTLLFIALSFTYPLLSGLDLAVSRAMPINFLVPLSKIIDILFDTVPMLIISLLLAAYLYLKNRRYDALQFSLTMVADAALLFIIKLIATRPRPVPALIESSSYSFPSGHAATAAVFFGLLTYMFFRKKPIAKALSLALVLLIAFSRLCLNVHYLTDVIAGLLLGASILSFSLLAREYIRRRSAAAKPRQA